MRLKDRNGAIPNGLWYVYQDEKGNSFRVNGMDLTLGKQFFSKIRGDMTSKNVSIPENLEYIVEQQICSRIPKSLYWEEAGDVTANIIHKFANVGDSVAASIGMSPNLEKRAKNCPACQKRREALNKLSR